MTDLHSHLLPYVDDGAHDLEEAERLLGMEAEQGVRTVCLTPHLREGMFETPDEVIRAHYGRLCPIAEAKGLRLYLSREYHYDGLFRERLRTGVLLPIGGRVLLTEFSYAHSAGQMLAAAAEIRRYRYTPLIAHIERYAAADAETVSALRAAGALIQVNADAVLGHDGRHAKRLAWELLTAGLADVIASDAHSTGERPPRLKACGALLTRKLGEEPVRRMMYRMPRKLVRGKYHGG